MASHGTTPGPRLICLTGFMGCGKTTVGRKLARQLGWRFVDLDTRIEEHAGLKITEIFERLGEPAFREIEHEELVRALGEATELGASTVIALGGGTFAQPRNAELLRCFGAPERSPNSRRAVVVIWLDCPLEELLTRCVRMTHRPLFRDEASFRQLFEQRRPSYEQADYRVESDLDPRVVVEHILALGVAEGVSGVPKAPTGRVIA
jgi:shikimate kinase